MPVAGVGFVVGAGVAAVDVAGAVADYFVAGNCNRILCAISIERGRGRDTLDWRDAAGDAAGDAAVVDAAADVADIVGILISTDKISK